MEFEDLPLEWQEALSYTYKIDGSYFSPWFEDGYIYYNIQSKGSQHKTKWLIPKDTNLYTLTDYKRHTAPNIYFKYHKDFCGPVQPQPSPVILKIREMESRRQAHHV